VIYAIRLEDHARGHGFRVHRFVLHAAVERRVRCLGGGRSQAVIAQMEEFRRSMRTVFRLPMTFIEICPVGVLISLISAGLLRNSRFLPARTSAHSA
jgi:hypothetical protein